MPIKRRVDDNEDDEDAKPVKKASRLPPPPPSSSSKTPGKFKHTFTRAHQLLLQCMLVRKTMEEKEMEELLAALLKETKETGAGLGSAVASINAMLNEDSGAFHLVIKSRLAVEENGKRIYALVNTRADAISKQSTALEEWQLNMFKITLGLIAKSDNGYVGHSDVSHAFELKKTADVHTALDKLAGLGWLEEHPTEVNMYTAGRRTMVELSDTMREVGAVECAISKQPVVRTPKYQQWLAARQTGVPGSGSSQG